MQFIITLSNMGKSPKTREKVLSRFLGQQLRHMMAISGVKRPVASPFDSRVEPTGSVDPHRVGRTGWQRSRRMRLPGAPGCGGEVYGFRRNWNEGSGDGAKAFQFSDTTSGTAIGPPISWGGFGGQCRHIWHTRSAWDW